ncbi:MAG: hypothetical protein HUJ29_05980 [Gammaproteobacteria bacterium]|nr:hypothetical protein [Gammaproteobacteria bacterium]
MDINQIIQSSHSSASLSRDAVSQLSADKSTAADSERDSVELSQEGVYLNDLEQGGIEWGKTFKTVPPIPRTFDELATWINQYKTAVQERIQEIFIQEGVQQEEDAQLQLQDDGSITVQGGGQQAGVIEDVANNNPAVQSLLQSANQRNQLFDVLGFGNDLRLASNDGERAQAGAALAQRLSEPVSFQLTLRRPDGIDGAATAEL